MLVDLARNDLGRVMEVHFRHRVDTQLAEPFEQHELQIFYGPSLPLSEREQGMKPCGQILHLYA
jgi:hypothetical protein